MALEAETNDRDALVKEFARKHGITPGMIIDRQTEAVHSLESSQRAVARSLPRHQQRLIDERTWGLVASMLDRAHDYAAAGLVLVAVGHTVSAEIVARTTAEASINVLYVLEGNRAERLWQYFSSYIATERDQNRRWRSSLPAIGEKERRVHLQAIERKEAILEQQANELATAFQQIGVTTGGTF
jgi:hypothetical protein